jgi:hypothetical protein
MVFERGSGDAEEVGDGFFEGDMGMRRKYGDVLPYDLASTVRP